MSSVAGPAKRKATSLKSAVVVVCLTFATASICAAQYNGGGHAVGSAPVPHFSGPPIPTGGPPIPTGAPPVPGYPSGYSYHYHYGPYFNGYNYGRGYRGGGWAYVVPYYYPADDSAYGYDYVGAGPDLYSGPPVGPNDPTLHMIVEQPPVDGYGYGPPVEAQGYSAPQPAAVPPAVNPAAANVNNDVKPGEPIVLVFRNGQQQEVTNYAIMGDTLYVFDKGKKKIALADVDIPATMKANDDRGLEFKVPPTPKKKATAPAPQNGKPDATTDGTPPNIAAVIPR
jgi:hypothetical protein